MYLECLLVSVNYSDFLTHVLNHNHEIFDNIVVVTDKKDVVTQELVQKYSNTKCVVTDRLYENGDKFNKGKAINDGVKFLKNEGVVVITDSDMIIDKQLRSKIPNLQEDYLYGAPRYMCPNYEAWSNYLKDESEILKWPFQHHRKAIGVGYFQMFNPNSDTIKNKNGVWYNEGYGTAGRTDRFFSRIWKGIIKLDLKLIHLDSDLVTMGTNWHGRVSQQFGETK